MMILSRQSRALVIDAIREASRFVEEHKGKRAVTAPLPAHFPLNFNVSLSLEVYELETPRRLLRRFESVEQSFENVGEVKV
jgi:hypothetical protein